MRSIELKPGHYTVIGTRARLTTHATWRRDITVKRAA